jgi:serine/threonine protein kinase
LNFLQNTLTYDPKLRFTAEEALNHPYLRRFINLPNGFFKVRGKNHHFRDLRKLLSNRQCLGDFKHSVFNRLNIKLLKHYNKIEERKTRSNNKIQQIRIVSMLGSQS